MEGIACHLGFPYFPMQIFYFYWEMTAPQLLRNCDKCDKDPQPLWKSALSRRTIIKVKNKVILAWCNSFHLSSDLAIFTINLISLWYLPKEQSAETGGDLRYGLTFRMQQPKMQWLSGGLQEVVTYSVQESNHIGPLPRRGPGTSTLWKIIYCMQFPSYTGHV